MHTVKNAKALSYLSIVLLLHFPISFTLHNTDKESAVLANPEICIDKIIALYYTSLFAGHQGVVKMYLTMRDKFFIPN